MIISFVGGNTKIKHTFKKTRMIKSMKTKLYKSNGQLNEY